MWMIYGANGYTGTLAARYAKDHDLRPVVAGRRVRALAGGLGLESRVFDLADEAVAAKNLEGIAAVLHCGSVLRHQQADARRVPGRRNALPRVMACP